MSLVVAPLVGAWIETSKGLVQVPCGHVAPLVGAWIETLFIPVGEMSLKSHPSWVRGLKQMVGRSCFRAQLVAPLVGAWIETPSSASLPT